MAVINIGSLNIDNVYFVPHFVRPGETLHASRLEKHAGGKGLNQSIALSRAGVRVKHAGMVGNDGSSLLDTLREGGVDISLMETVDGPNGHSFIQVQQDGQNAITLFGGSNMAYHKAFILSVLEKSNPAEDVILLQNEINDLPFVIEQAKTRGFRIVFNAAPCGEEVKNYPLEMLDLLIINEIEGEILSGEKNPERAIQALNKIYPNTGVVLTLGEHGVRYARGSEFISVPSVRVEDVVDTTSAGDTFTGYFMSAWLKNEPVEACLELACRASSLCIQRAGSSSSVPFIAEVCTPATLCS